ncbi:MAG: glycosyltransferase family 2 protein [Candidatus Aenigmatarchaeota archaeon]|nr:MAG: glycosyltransferase family 2 protein [Candidatus Aenigmarchaeota archaeon]
MISVIIPTYNEEKNIENCLKSLLNQILLRKEFEIIVVDGKSKDKTVKIAKKYADKVIQQKSKGIGGARNDGVKLAKYDLIATTDADCLVPENWFENIISAFKDEEIVAVCGSDGPIENSIKANIIFLLIRNFIRVSSYFGIYCLGGTNSAFRKKAFLKIGGYRDLPHSDDADLGFRLKKVGRIKYIRKLFVRFSVRRMEKDGYINIIWTWLKGDILLLLNKPIKTKKRYIKQDYN